jgi:hypothetical protein
MGHVIHPFAIAALLFFVTGCPLEDPGDTVIGDDDDDSAPSTLDAFFALDPVHTIDIALADGSYEALLDDPYAYAEASITIDDTTLAAVGVRLKGSAGSFVALDGEYPEISQDGNGNPGKSAFIVDFNRIVDDQDYLGLTKLTMNNLVQDDSGIHEVLAYSLFRASGVPASRVGYAEVTLDGEDKGLYALVESNDNSVFLDTWFGTDEGNLYEGQYGTDLREGQAEAFDQDHGDDESRQDLQDLIDALTGLEPGEDAMAALTDSFDLDEYLAFATAELYLGHWDGYAFSANNYKIHHIPDGDWSFVPWGIDQVFEETFGHYSGVMQGPGPSWDGGGRVHEVCFMTPDCVDRLADAFADLLDRVDSEDLIGQAEEARAVVEPYLLAEATAHGDPAMTEEALDGVVEFIEGRRDQLEEWLPCLQGEFVDLDGDGFDGCTEDCDDWNPEIHPGAEEHCNFVDDDCNGVLDDPLDCPSCYETTGPDGAEYALCLDELSWDGARSRCQERGQELASIHGDEVWEFLSFGFLDLSGTWESWIGLNDTAEPGTWVWTDGSPLDYDRWSMDAPAPEDFGFHCVMNTLEGWWNQPCEEPRRFICGS